MEKIVVKEKREEIGRKVGEEEKKRVKKKVEKKGILSMGKEKERKKEMLEWEEMEEVVLRKKWKVVVMMKRGEVKKDGVV
ncbi:hypothetical protein [Priestia megaterium]|uniref:hypothetical protein n=1 Tax=Priestia megaterium TaxID=1404 RepID=UPI0012B8C284|nr:hypothetical protein [Priestia megaterium]